MDLRAGFELCGIGDWVERKTLAQIIPAPFFHDVKYMSTMLMETGLDSAAWTHKDYDTY
ncbi:hypothetical protein WKW80_16505 [Variovorax humicola]|uniref:Uncharacterized protein n=1 Tax=Variovorax humicola TaxID=1769758 RepID=A0ABU8W0P2_9BURK